VTRRPLLLGLWLGGTLTAMVMASFAVQLASAKVTDRPAAVVSRRQVQTELDTPTSSTVPPATAAAVAPVSGDASPTVPATDPNTASRPVPTSPPSTVGPGGPTTPGPAVIPSSTVAPPPTAAPSTTRPPSATTTTSRPFDDGRHDGDGRGGPGDGRDDGPFDGHGGPDTPTTTTTSPTTTLTVLGGWVRVRCEAWSASLVSASPNPGFSMQIVDHGPQEVEVRFSAPSHESVVKARCENGTLRPDTDERG